MAEWEKVKVGNMGKVVTGKTPKTANSEYYGGKIPFLTPSDDMAVKYIRDTKKHITEAGRMSVKNATIPANSICVSCIGSDLGKVVITTEETVTNQQINSVIVNESQYDIDFVYYSMVELGKVLNFHSKTSTAVPIVNKSSFSQYEISCPELNIQRKIGDVLSKLDEKIEENIKINNNLFAQAQALYKHHFIDLLPYNGLMPADWHQGTVSEVIELHDAKRIPLSSRERASLDKVYPYYGATSVMDYVDRYLFDGIYLLLGEDGTVVDSNGYPILQYVEGKFWVNNHAHILTGKNGFSVELLYLLFSLTNVRSIVTGAVQPKISQANLNKVPVTIPSAGTLSDFDETIQPFFSKIRNLRAENDRLATIRDTLLPQLMSGKLDVSKIDI
jgi:type I restriction enzyme S subunit